MKRTQLNLGLAAAVLALGAAVWVSREKPQALPPLTSLAEDELATITIAHPDAATIRLEKRGDAWRLVEPVDAPTDPFEVSSLIGLAKLEVKRSLPLAEVALGELQLDPPRYTITLNDQVLAFGDTEPIEYRRYVRHGDQVALVADPPSAALDADYSDLVARELLMRGAQIQRIEVPGLTVRREADGVGWTAEGVADASADQLAAFVDAWSSARAMWNARRPADAESGAGGEPVRIVTADGEIALRVVAREPQLQIDRADYGLRYTLSKADAERLLQLPAAPAPETEAAAPADGAGDADHSH